MNLFRLAAGRRTKWLILAGWAAIVFALIGGALDFDSAQNNRDANYLPKDAESLTAIAVEERAFGDELLSGLLVFHNPAGLSAKDKAAIVGDAKELTKQPVEGQFGKPVPLFFEDGKTAGLYLQLKAKGDQQILFAASDRLRALADRAPPGLETKLTGQIGFFDDSVRILDSIDGSLLVGTIILITLLLLLIYRSPFLWALPLMAVGLAEITARGVGTQLAENGATITTQAASLMTVLVFGVGTDYALLVIARYREELRNYEDRHEAMEHALSRSGPPIFASAATVAAALLCLTLANVNATSGAGPIGAMGILFAMLAMLTALPALLLVFDRRVFWPFIPVFGSGTGDVPVNFWSRLADRIARNPWKITVTVFALMAVMALGLTTHPGGLDLTKSFHKKVESVEGMNLLSKALPPGATGPLTVLVDEPTQVPKVLAALKRSPDIANLGLIQKGKGAVRIEATLKYSPYSDEAIAAIPSVRSQVSEAAPGAAFVSGATAVEADSRHFAAEDNKLIMPIVLLVVTLILILLLRALVAPVVLMITVVASFIAVLGASYLVFEHVFGFPGVDEYVPLFVFIFLVALGVDYNIFLMARVREEALIFGAREGMRRALIVTGGVITSAGIVLAGTFLVMASMPITMLTEIGFAIALGVLFDALIVRTTLVPALGFIMGRALWWPSGITDTPSAAAARPVLIPAVQAGPPGSVVQPPAPQITPGEASRAGYDAPPPIPHQAPPAEQPPTAPDDEDPQPPQLPDWTRIGGSGRYR